VFELKKQPLILDCVGEVFELKKQPLILDCVMEVFELKKQPLMYFPDARYKFTSLTQSSIKGCFFSSNTSVTQSSIKGCF
jgi:hypothetical protein